MCDMSTFSGYPTATGQLYFRAVVLAQSDVIPDCEGSRKGEISWRDLKLYPIYFDCGQ